MKTIVRLRQVRYRIPKLRIALWTLYKQKSISEMPNLSAPEKGREKVSRNVDGSAFLRGLAVDVFFSFTA